MERAWQADQGPVFRSVPTKRGK